MRLGVALNGIAVSLDENKADIYSPRVCHFFLLRLYIEHKTRVIVVLLKTKISSRSLKPYCQSHRCSTTDLLILLLLLPVLYFVTNLLLRRTYLLSVKLLGLKI